jgi:glucokinase
MPLVAGVAGVDLGGTKIQAVVVRDGAIVGSDRVKTPERGPDEVIDAIVATVRSAVQQAGDAELSAVGIGTPGGTDEKTGVVSLAKNVPGFTGTVELGPKVSEGLGGVAVRINNDVRVAVLGEYHRGAGRPFRDVLGVFVGTGVGGGLIFNGELRTGRGAAGEIGHTVVKHEGRRCSCGRRGCLEAYAGRGCMEARARKLVADGRKTILFDLMEHKGRDRLTSGVFAAALDDGDDMARELIDDAVWALGVGLASAQNLLDVEALVIGGGLGDRLGTPFVDRVRDSMQPHLFVPDRPPQVLGTELRDLSGAVGAAVFAGG